MHLALYSRTKGTAHTGSGWPVAARRSAWTPLAEPGRLVTVRVEGAHGQSSSRASRQGFVESSAAARPGNRRGGRFCNSGWRQPQRNVAAAVRWWLGFGRRGRSHRPRSANRRDPLGERDGERRDRDGDPILASLVALPGQEQPLDVLAATKFPALTQLSPGQPSGRASRSPRRVRSRSWARAPTLRGEAGPTAPPLAGLPSPPGGDIRWRPMAGGQGADLGLGEAAVALRWCSRPARRPPRRSPEKGSMPALAHRATVLGET